MTLPTLDHVLDPVIRVFDGVAAYAVLINRRYRPFERSTRAPCIVITLSDGKPSVADEVHITLNVPPCTDVLVCRASDGKQLIVQPCIAVEVGAVVTIRPLPYVS